ncbi:cohesin loading factor-domain-containing protein [Cladochytrium replicatum]|nr:cohesin loading factor-domain-containing protein [Cladochytrium replicatum]
MWDCCGLPTPFQGMSSQLPHARVQPVEVLLNLAAHYLKNARSDSQIDERPGVSAKPPEPSSSKVNRYVTAGVACLEAVLKAKNVTNLPKSIEVRARIALADALLEYTTNVTQVKMSLSKALLLCQNESNSWRYRIFLRQAQLMVAENDSKGAAKLLKQLSSESLAANHISWFRKFTLYRAALSIREDDVSACLSILLKSLDEAVKLGNQTLQIIFGLEGLRCSIVGGRCDMAHRFSEKLETVCSETSNYNSPNMEFCRVVRMLTLQYRVVLELRSGNVKEGTALLGTFRDAKNQLFSNKELELDRNQSIIVKLDEEVGGMRKASEARELDNANTLLRMVGMSKDGLDAMEAMLCALCEKGSNPKTAKELLQTSLSQIKARLNKDRTCFSPKTSGKTPYFSVAPRRIGLPQPLHAWWIRQEALCLQQLFEVTYARAELPAAIQSLKDLSALCGLHQSVLASYHGIIPFNWAMLHQALGRPETSSILYTSIISQSPSSAAISSQYRQVSLALFSLSSSPSVQRSNQEQFRALARIHLSITSFVRSILDNSIQSPDDIQSLIQNSVLALQELEKSLGTNEPGRLLRNAAFLCMQSIMYFAAGEIRQAKLQLLELLKACDVTNANQLRYIALCCLGYLFKDTSAEQAAKMFTTASTSAKASGAYDVIALCARELAIITPSKVAEYNRLAAKHMRAADTRRKEGLAAYSAAIY